ncbi:MAG: hypothetical protein LQ343_006545 [Gyalolechia ehrenbergii]|nr:MAG: hypothetical protein LQ343_006545 [Gyalolechia ehrenbergii]
MIAGTLQWRKVTHHRASRDTKQNKDSNTSSAGGSHWSLLVVSVVDAVAFHYDSLLPANRDEAITTTRKLSKLLNQNLHFLDLPDSPQQENGSDCGVFVCVQMKHLLVRKLLVAHNKEKINMSMGGKHLDASQGRKEMLRIIEAFRREGEKRRSYVEGPSHLLPMTRTDSAKKIIKSEYKQ